MYGLVVAASEKGWKGIIDGCLHPLTDPINNQNGKERIAAGEAMDGGVFSARDRYAGGVAAWGLLKETTRKRRGDDPRVFVGKGSEDAAAPSSPGEGF